METKDKMEETKIRKQAIEELRNERGSFKWVFTPMKTFDISKRIKEIEERQNMGEKNSAVAEHYEKKNEQELEQEIIGQEEPQKDWRDELEENILLSLSAEKEKKEIAEMIKIKQEILDNQEFEKSRGLLIRIANRFPRITMFIISGAYISLFLFIILLNWLFD